MSAQIKVENKTLGASVKQAWGGLVGVFNKDSKMYAEAAKGGGKVNILERVASKPFRMIGAHPRLAMGAAVVGGVAWMNGQHEEKQKLAELEYQAQAQQAQSYKNTVSPAEWQDAQSQFRTTSPQGGGFADRVTAERAAAQQVAQGA